MSNGHRPFLVRLIFKTQYYYELKRENRKNTISIFGCRNHVCTFFNYYYTVNADQAEDILIFLE